MPKHYSEKIIKDSGTISLGAGATVTIKTITRQAGEVFLTPSFVVDDVNLLSWGEGGDVLNATDSIMLGLQKTGNANEFKLKAKNKNLTTGRTIEWKLLAF